MEERNSKRQKEPIHRSYMRPNEKEELNFILDELDRLHEKKRSIWRKLYGKTGVRRVWSNILYFAKLIPVAVCLYFVFDYWDIGVSRLENFVFAYFFGFLLFGFIFVDTTYDGVGWTINRLIDLLSPLEQDKYRREITDTRRKMWDLESRFDAIQEIATGRYHRDLQRGQELRDVEWKRKMDRLNSRSKGDEGYYDDASDVGDSGSDLGDTMDGGDDGGE